MLTIYCTSLSKLNTASKLYKAQGITFATISKQYIIKAYRFDNLLVKFQIEYLASGDVMLLEKF